MDSATRFLTGEVVPLSLVIGLSRFQFFKKPMVILGDFWCLPVVTDTRDARRWMGITIIFQILNLLIG
jgi:hypothetical protein